MVAQQGRLPLTLVGVGVDIIYWTEGGKEERRKETKKIASNLTTMKRLDIWTKEPRLTDILSSNTFEFAQY